MGEDMAWCPDCGAERDPDEHVTDGRCTVCEALVVDERPLASKARAAAARVVTFAVAAAFAFGPLIYTAYRAYLGGPMWATEQVTYTATKTNHYGIVPDVLAVVIPWLVLLVIIFGVLYGPRRI